MNEYMGAKVVVLEPDRLPLR